MASTFVILLIVCAILLLFRKSIYNAIIFRRMIAKLPRLPYFALPLIGHTHLLAGTPEVFFHSLLQLTRNFRDKVNEKLGVLWLGPVPLIVIVHPDAAEMVLKSSKHMEKAFSYRFLHPWLGTGLLTSAGEKWKQRRRLITPSFHFNILQDFLEVMNEQSNILVKKLKNSCNKGHNVNVGQDITLCALDVICETAMGQTVNAQTNSESVYVKAIYRISDLVQLRQKTPALWWDCAFNKMKLGKEHASVLKTLHDFTKHVIKSKMERKGKSVNTSKRMAFLDVLMHAATEDGTELSFEDIQEEVDTFMFEGHDTTAAAMTWAVYLIGRHPDVQRRIHDELDEVFGDDKDRPATLEDIRKLQYLEQVIKESLRIFPSVPLMGRVTSEECEIAGHILPEKTQVVVFVYEIHHNPLVWKDPDNFDPDRFSKENSVGRHPFAYIPFSAGPRNCIGQRFALLEEKVILSQLMRSFTITSLDKQEEIKMVGDLILRPATRLNVELKQK